MPKHYRVWPIPNATDVEREAHFAVRGPDMETFTEQHRLAAVMKQAINRPALTAFERSAARTALGFALAGDTSMWTDKMVEAMHRAQAKLS